MPKVSRHSKDRCTARGILLEHGRDLARSEVPQAEIAHVQRAGNGEKAAEATEESPETGLAAATAFNVLANVGT